MGFPGAVAERGGARGGVGGVEGVGRAEEYGVG